MRLGMRQKYRKVQLQIFVRKDIRRKSVFPENYGRKGRCVRNSGGT